VRLFVMWRVLWQWLPFQTIFNVDLFVCFFILWRFGRLPISFGPAFEGYWTRESRIDVIAMTTRIRLSKHEKVKFQTTRLKTQINNDVRDTITLRQVAIKCLEYLFR